MSLLVLFAGLITALILDRQSRRQIEGIRMACERFGVEVPPVRPRIKKLEAGLNIYIGGFLTLFSALYLLVTLMYLQEKYAAEAATFSALFMGTGAAMTMLGVRALREWKLLGKFNP
jgi:hypothetical protein